MKHYLIVPFLLLAVSCLMAQPTDSTGLYPLALRNGVVLEGRVVESVGKGKLLFLLDNGKTVLISAKSLQQVYNFRDRGWYQAAAVGMMPNTVSRPGGRLNGLEMSMVVGHQWSRWLGTGLGTGAYFYRPWSGEIVYPVFAEGRSYLMKQKSSPYVVLRAGYGFAFRNRSIGIAEASGGKMFNPAIGYRFGDHDGLKLCFDLGLMFQEAAFTYTSGTDRSDIDLIYRRLNFRVALLL